MDRIEFNEILWVGIPTGFRNCVLRAEGVTFLLGGRLGFIASPTGTPKPNLVGATIRQFPLLGQLATLPAPFM